MPRGNCLPLRPLVRGNRWLMARCRGMHRLQESTRGVECCGSLLYRSKVLKIVRYLLIQMKKSTSRLAGPDKSSANTHKCHGRRLDAKVIDRSMLAVLLGSGERKVQEAQTANQSRHHEAVDDISSIAANMDSKTFHQTNIRIRCWVVGSPGCDTDSLSNPCNGLPQG